MARLRYWWHEGWYWIGRWVAKRLDLAIKNHIERLNRD